MKQRKAYKHILERDMQLPIQDYIVIIIELIDTVTFIKHTYWSFSSTVEGAQIQITNRIIFIFPKIHMKPDYREYDQEKTKYWLFPSSEKYNIT